MSEHTTQTQPTPCGCCGFPQIAKAYPSVDGFCVLMGTDTMAYASTGECEKGHEVPT